MYKITIDKPEIFEADIQIEGANSNSAQCRLIIETNDISLLFNGSISNGKCSVNLPKLKNYISETRTGNIRLEVIVEDTFFTPWQDQFEISLSKKVTAEVRQSTSPANILKEPKVIVKNTVSKQDIIEDINKQLKVQGITSKNARRNSENVKKINENIVKKFKITPKESFSYILQVLKS